MDAKERSKPAEQTSASEQKGNNTPARDVDPKTSENVKGGLAGGGDPGQRKL